MPFLAQEDVDDEIALAGALAACGTQAVDVIGGGVHGLNVLRSAGPETACGGPARKDSTTNEPIVEPRNGRSLHAER